MSEQFSANVKITKVKDAVAAGTTSQSSSTVDMLGYEGVIFLASFGTAAANNSFNIQGSDDDSSYNDIAGSSVVNSTTDKNFFIDMHKPLKHRYYQLIALRGTSTTIENMWAIQYGAHSEAVVNVVSTKLFGKALVSPADGTP